MIKICLFLQGRNLRIQKALWNMPDKFYKYCTVENVKNVSKFELGK